MHQLIINKLGPIEHCELKCSQYMAFTGFQSSGKSTIAKAIYFFRTIKEDIYRLAEERALNAYSLEETIKGTLKNALISFLREKFLRVFGSSWGMDNDMYLEYHYTDQCYVRITLKEDNFYPTPNYIFIDLSSNLRRYLEVNENTLEASVTGVTRIQKQKMMLELRELFDDKYNVVYIPAGRSMMTLLSQQLNIIYMSMKETQKRTLDYCTQDYIERILNLKSEFSDGLVGLVSYLGAKSKCPKRIIDYALDLIEKVLRGKYTFSNGEERINISDNKYVKINFASSGQQESVWILNLLFYYLVNTEPVMFIIEEPESHLFPASQKYITELISLVNNSGHSVVITTHSPYVLGTLNNLLYASKTPDDMLEQANRIIPKELWLSSTSFNAWFVKDGGIDDCMDSELQLIQNEKIDEISKEINQDFDNLFELQMDE